MQREPDEQQAAHTTCLEVRAAHDAPRRRPVEVSLDPWHRIVHLRRGDRLRATWTVPARAVTGLFLVHRGLLVNAGSDSTCEVCVWRRRRHTPECYRLPAAEPVDQHVQEHSRDLTAAPEARWAAEIGTETPITLLGQPVTATAATFLENPPTLRVWSTRRDVVLVAQGLGDGGWDITGEDLVVQPR